MRLDLEKIVNRETEFHVGLTDVQTAKASYLKANADNLERVIKASSSIPIVYRNFIKIDDIGYVNGGLADPIPYDLE